MKPGICGRICCTLKIFSRDEHLNRASILFYTFVNDTLAEWLRRRPAKPMGSPCVGSNPTGVAFNFKSKMKGPHKGPIARQADANSNDGCTNSAIKFETAH